MGNAVDRIGERWGALLVIERAGSKGKSAAWLCRCDCGNIHIVSAVDLRSGSTSNCGCQRGQYAIGNTWAKTHGRSKTRTYTSWAQMKNRCTNPNAPNWRLYGGRGISFDPKWRSFAEFYADMGERPEGRTLDRIDHDGDYSKANCRWATPLEQSRNQRDPGGWKTRRANLTC